VSFAPRPYQERAIRANVEFLTTCNKPNYHGLCILATGAGKSVVIAHTVMGLDSDVLILQPSKEILEQNYAKYISYGYRAGIYSASLGQKYKDKVTFATIGSIIRKKHLFRKLKYLLVDECHLINPADGMYSELIRSIPGVKMVGLTATPYRLESSYEGAMLNFLTRSDTRFFKKVLYYIQNSELFDNGYLAKLRYFSFDVINRSMLEMNKEGTDYDVTSLKNYYREINMPGRTIEYAQSILSKRRSLLIFSALIAEAKQVAAGIPGSVILTGETDKDTREKLLSKFKSGAIRCVVNVGCLTTGFDYPQLEAVLIARSTMSLALYYQIVGRVMRPHPKKDSGWVVDLGGNIRFFGKIETMQIKQNHSGEYSIWNNGRQLTNVQFQK
jgi:DNA repair protein RadD